MVEIHRVFRQGFAAGAGVGRQRRPTHLTVPHAGRVLVVVFEQGRVAVHGGVKGSAVEGKWERSSVDVYLV